MALTIESERKTHLERNVVVANAYLELLLADNVLLRPVCVVFPERHRSRDEICAWGKGWGEDSLSNFARLDDALELLHDERAHPHCPPHPGKHERPGSHGQHPEADETKNTERKQKVYALSLRMRLSFR